MLYDLLDFSGYGFCQLSIGGEIVIINSVAFDFLGLDEKFSGIAECAGKKMPDLFSEYKELFDNEISSDTSIRNKVIDIINLKGEKKYLIHNIVVNQNEHVKENVFILIEDITDRKIVEDDLIRSKKKLKSIINIIPDIVYRVNPKGKITFISDSIEHYGYTSDELIGVDILDLIHPDDRDKASRKIKERRTGDRKTLYYSVRFLKKNNDIVTFEFEDVSLKGAACFEISAEGIYISNDDNSEIFIGTQGIARDVSNKWYIEYSLKKAEEKFNSVLESLEDGFYEADLDGKIIFVNDSLCKIFGYEKDEIIGENYSKFITSEEKDTIYNKFNEVYKTGVSSKLSDWIAIRKDDKRRFVEGSISVMKDDNGKTTGFLGILRDITKRKKVERELLQARKLEAIGIFSGGIAHDFNNALTAIIGNISLAKMDIDPDNAELMDVLNDAENASLRVKELTQRLSTFSKGGKPVKKSTDLVELVEECMDMTLSGFKGICKLDVSETIENVEIDEFQISHVIENLLVNAKEALPGGGKITVTIENINVEKEASHHEISLQPGKYIRVSIEDDGVGIDSENINNIFDPYFSTKDFASGMGLATSYAIIKRHRGYIDIKSELGEGSIFYIYFTVPDEE